MTFKTMAWFIIFITFAIANSSYGKSVPQVLPKTEVTPKSIPEKHNIWVFIMAGQSNMAGRGRIAPKDTLPINRVLSINKSNQVILAKEPLHFYEPRMTGLDCGRSFGIQMLRHVPDSVSILLVPTAVGGSSINRWISDSNHRGVHLLSNFKEKVETAQKYGEIKAILWHQGESDANPKGIEARQKKMAQLFSEFRKITNNDSLPIIIGKLGSYSKHKAFWQQLNEQNHRYAQKDKNCTLVTTSNLKDKGDLLHFNAKGQRKLGQRYAKQYLKTFADQ